MSRRGAGMKRGQSKPQGHKQGKPASSAAVKPDKAAANTQPSSGQLLAVLVVEAVNFDATMFDTNDISTIRGSSLALLDAINLLVRNLEEIETPEGHRLLTLNRGASVLEIAVYLQAGNATANQAYVDRLVAIAKAFCIGKSAIPAGLSSPELPNLGLFTFRFAVARANEVRATSGEILQKLTGIARARLRRRQFQTLTLPLPLSEDLPVWQNILASNRPPSDSGWPSFVVEAGKYVTRSAQLRRAYGRTARSEIIPRILREELGTNQNDQSCAELNDLIDRIENCGFTRDLGELCPKEAEIDRWQLPIGATSKIALIHIDGNKFGRRRDVIASPQHRALFSAKLRQMQAQLLHVLALAAIGPDAIPGLVCSVSGAIRIECLLLGGDELVIAVPAFAAFDVMSRLQAGMVNLTCDEKWFPHDGAHLKRLTYASAIVIAKYKAPIRQLRKIAAELNDLVKNRPKGRSGLPVGVLVIEGFAAPHATAEDLLRESYDLDSSGEKLAGVVTFPGEDGTRAPWQHQLTTLRSIATALKPSQLHRQIELSLAASQTAHDLKADFKRIGVTDPDQLIRQLSLEAVGGNMGGRWVAFDHLRHLGDFLGSLQEADAR